MREEERGRGRRRGARNQRDGMQVHLTLLINSEECCISFEEKELTHERPGRSKPKRWPTMPYPHTRHLFGRAVGQELTHERPGRSGRERTDVDECGLGSGRRFFSRNEGGGKSEEDRAGSIKSEKRGAGGAGGAGEEQQQGASRSSRSRTIRSAQQRNAEQRNAEQRNAEQRSAEQSRIGVHQSASECVASCVGEEVRRRRRRR